ncbi:hypothetical protein AWJ20_1593 [Sugiyamaella lignohabitans]|uniref:Fe2OG dioxygenase domain-containing protein n=1 Tax=Sugiyamaella lignohabitans TaxID=796027 RepID=A0A161HK68_9ASCO|nr:uncharacterized protein AWJ20_1593 [Sugiyamaella lignohabitans]ANB13307.1 hypothetical protein AWJ20_1593 [Sugiyamaella lignohabitans]
MTEVWSASKLAISESEKKLIDQKYNVRPFLQAPLSTVTNNVVNLQVIDLSKFTYGQDGLEIRRSLAAQLEKALTTQGFFSVIGHGFQEEKLEALRAFTQSVFELPQEIKDQYMAGERNSEEEKNKSLGIVRGAGFKPRGYWVFQNGVRDSLEHYNFRDMLHDDHFVKRHYPELVRSYLQEVAEFYRYLHYVVLRKILVLCDIILELREGTLWGNYFKVIENDLRNSGAGFGRFMQYYSTSQKDDEKSGKTWLRGHSDASGFTFLTSQPILSLQILDYQSNEWKYVNHVPSGLIVNVGDALKFLTGGYFKSCIHRVTTPPDDQRNFRRMTLVYFCDPALTTVIDPDGLESPKLRRQGISTPSNWQKITFEQWDEEKGKMLNTKEGDKKKPVPLFGRSSIIHLPANVAVTTDKL